MKERENKNRQTEIERDNEINKIQVLFNREERRRTKIDKKQVDRKTEIERERERNSKIKRKEERKKNTFLL